MKEFLDFLNNRFHALGCQQKFNFSVEPTTSSPRYKNGSSFRSNNFRNETAQFPPRVHQNFHTFTGREGKCPFRCSDSHEATKCERFLRADACTKQDLVNCAKLCKNCLKPHGGIYSMQSGCKFCRSYHHYLLHPNTSIESADRRSIHTQSLRNTSNSRRDNSADSNAEGKNSLVRSSHHIHVGPKADN